MNEAVRYVRALALVAIALPLSVVAQDAVNPSPTASEQVKEIALAENWRSRWEINEDWIIPELSSRTAAGRIREIILSSPIANQIQGYACHGNETFVVLYLDYNYPVPNSCQPLLLQLDR
jgi:hypothetical protein